MNIKVNLQDGTPAKFKTEIVDGNLVVTVVEEEKQEKNLFPKWEELEGRISGHYVNSEGQIIYALDHRIMKGNENIFTTLDLVKASLATARVSQTYKRYREFVGEISIPTIRYPNSVDEVAVIKTYGLLRMTFANPSDWEKFYESNKEDLKAILYVSSNTQL